MPLTRALTGYLMVAVVQGSASSCFMPSETRSVSRSNLSTTTRTSSPTSITSLGWLMRPHDMSVMCSRPSMPPRSTKAPYSVMFLTDARQDLALLERLEGLGLALGVLLLEDRLAREHDVAALLVDLDDAHAELLPLERVEVADGPHVHLAAGQEGADADVDGEAALHPLDHPAHDDAALLVGALDVVPDLHLLGLLLGEDHVAVAVLGLLDQDVDRVAGLDHDLPGLVAELLERDHALGLVADVDDHLGLGDPQHDAPHHLALGEVAEADVVHVEELLVLLGVETGLGGLVVEAAGRMRHGARSGRRSCGSSRSPA